MVAQKSRVPRKLVEVKAAHIENSSQNRIPQLQHKSGVQNSIKNLCLISSFSIHSKVAYQASQADMR